MIMVHQIFNYLLESALCLVLFAITYRVLIAGSTNFSRMRFYLLASVLLSLILPIVAIPVEWSSRLVPTGSFPNVLLMPAERAVGAVVSNHPDLVPADPGISVLQVILFTAFIVYMAGVSYKFYRLVKNLLNMHGFIKNSAKVKEGNYWIVDLKSEIPAFSFFNYIFINNAYKNLSAEELRVIKRHEMLHVSQYHSLDVLFIELVGIFFWFNPAVNYLKASLKEVHEYMVDEKIAGQGESRKAYAQLLLTLASGTKVFDLATNFAGELTRRRILMIAKPRTSSTHNLAFLVLLPLTAMLLLSFSCLKTPDANAGMQIDGVNARLKNGTANWRNTSIWPDHMGLKEYCAVYFPSGKDAHLLKPMEIVLKDNKLFRCINAETDPGKRMVELHFESGHIFSYMDNSGRSIEFVIDADNKVMGCVLARRDGRYLLLEGEFSTRRPGN